MPPLLRLVFAGCVLALIGQLSTPWQPAGWTALFTSWHLPWPAFFASFFALVGLGAAVMVTVGAMGRMMALVIVFPVGFDMVVNGGGPLVIDYRKDGFLSVQRRLAVGWQQWEG